MRESVLQARFIRLVKEKKLGLAVKVDSTSRRGFPDVIFLDTEGYTTYLEFKTDSGRLSNHQHALHHEMIELGADVLTLTGEKGLNDFMRVLVA